MNGYLNIDGYCLKMDDIRAITKRYYSHDIHEFTIEMNDMTNYIIVRSSKKLLKKLRNHAINHCICWFAHKGTFCLIKDKVRNGWKKILITPLLTTECESGTNVGKWTDFQQRQFLMKWMADLEKQITSLGNILER